MRPELCSPNSSRPLALHKSILTHLSRDWRALIGYGLGFPEQKPKTKPKRTNSCIDHLAQSAHCWRIVLLGDNNKPSLQATLPRKSLCQNCSLCLCMILLLEGWNGAKKKSSLSFDDAVLRTMRCKRAIIAIPLQTIKQRRRNCTRTSHWQPYLVKQTHLDPRSTRSIR